MKEINNIRRLSKQPVCLGGFEAESKQQIWFSL
jgi:hypothetical protein